MYLGFYKCLTDQDIPTQDIPTDGATSADGGFFQHGYLLAYFKQAEVGFKWMASFEIILVES